MPLDKGKLQKLYSTLQKGGYSQSYDEFEKGFTGNDNYPNRKKVYDLLTEHGADIGNSYEDFMGKMQAPSQPSQPQQQKTPAPAPAPKPQPKPAPKPKSRPQPKAKGGGMTAAERAQFIRNAQGIVSSSAAGIQHAKNQMDYANSNRGLKVSPVHLGQNAKVVGQLNNAYAEADRLDKLLEQRGKELDAENQDKWWRDLPRGGGGAVSTMNANDNNGRMTDTEYLNLLAARKKVDEQIRDLKAARDEKTGTFLGGLWRGFRDYAFDPSNWDNGYRDLLTTSAMLRAKTGAAQTPREKASEHMMMEDTYKAGEAAQKAEKVLGNGYRFMRIGAQSLPFALQFMAGNAMGMTGGIARAGEGMGVKLARKIAIKRGANNMMRNIGRSVLKNTGVMLGDLGAATALTTTIQAGQTGSDIGQRYAGDVAYDPKTDDYKLEGGKSLGRSIYEGVANSAIENYTEMLGEHMHLGKFASSALTKVGLGKVSNWFTKVGKTDFMQGVNKYMKIAGFNGYPQEVMEEEVGIPLHAIFDGGNKMSDLLDGRQQLDIVGGMLFSMAGMGGASMAMQGGHKAAMAVQYHQDQHKLDNADKVASFRLTADKWAPIKEEIDGTTNADFGKTMKNVLGNEELSDQEKQAVWDYAQRLIIMRGHNMGQEAATRNGMTDKETNTANESYTKGYNTTDATAMNDARNTLAAAQQRLDGIFGENTDAQQILDAKNEDGSPYFTANDRKAAQDVVNAQQEYEGMMQRVRDDIDDEVQQTGAIYDSRTNDNGVIQSATLKAQNPDGTDKKVYITSGNVVMTDDGKSVDKQKSDMSIVVVDEDGKVQMISPDELFSLDTPIDGAQAKQQAIDAIQQSKAQEAADKINGKVNLTAGNTYTLTDNTGQQIEATIVADGQTGAVQNPDGTVNVSMNGKVVAMDVNTLQQMVDNTNMQKAEQGLDPRLTSRGTEQGAEDSEGQKQPTEQEGDQGILDQGGTVVPDDEGSGAVPSYPGSVVAPDTSEPHQWQVDDTFTIDNGGMPVRGQVTGVGEDGVEIYTESPVNGKKMQVVSPEELQSMTTEINGEKVQAPQDEAAAEQRPTEPSPTEESGVNGVNGEQAQEQAPQTQEQPQQTEGQPQRAIDRIPSQQVDDGKGNVRTVHNWEQAEPGDTYDALTEIYHGNADRVKKGIDNRVGKIDKAIKGIQKQMDAIDNSDDFDEVAAQSEQYDQLQQQKDALEQQKKYWQGVQMVPSNRKMDADRRSAEEQAAAKAAQEKAEAEAAEKARQEREQVNGVPDVVNDIPADARKRGFRNVNGMVVNRQGETQGVSGRESNVKFSSTDTAKGHIKVIDADQLQPSHVSGQRNPAFFIDEAQPKDRTDTVSRMAAAKIAADLNPEEITGDGSAYQFSAPTVNSRGEVIQGNNRSDALKLMYSTPAFKPAQDAYKQYIADHAEEFGFTPEDVQKIQQMEHPVMVNELDVPDDEAIRLGQMRASDNESGGIERIDPVTTSRKLGGKVSSFANVLLSSPDEDASLSDVLMQNGAKAVKWLRTQGAISDTAAQSAFDKKGNLTPEARMDLQNILKQSLFQGGVSDLSTMFDKMPAKAQKAILSTFMRDFDSAESERILPEIQKAIEAWYGCAMSNEAFAKASNYKAAKAAMHDWTLQTNLLDNNMPSDKFSNFAMELACRLQGCSMREAQLSLNDFFDLVQGKSQGDLFGGTTMGEQADRQESIRRIFNIEYKPINNGKTRSNAVADNSSQSGEGRQGSPTDGKGRERAESGSGSANGAGGTESHDEEGIDKGAVRTTDGGYSKLPTNYAYRITDAQELQDVLNNGMFRKMPDDKIVPGSVKTITSKSGRTFSFGKQHGNSHGGKAFAAGMPWGGTTSGGFTGERYYIAIPGNNVDGWRVGHHGHYSEPQPFDKIEAGKGLWLPFDEEGDVDLSTKGMRVFRKVGDTYYEVEHPEELFKDRKAAAEQRPTEPSEDSSHSIGATSSSEKKETERQGVNTEPSEKQKEAGNSDADGGVSVQGEKQGLAPRLVSRGTEPSTIKHETMGTDTAVADSKRKQFDLFVRFDLERFIAKPKDKRVAIDWEHSEPENDYIPMKIDGEPSFVGVTEQDSDTPMTFPSDRPIAIYDIAEGGDIPDATKIDKFEAYVKDYNAENNLTEDSDDYATMDDRYPYVAFKNVDAAVKFNDWLNGRKKRNVNKPKSGNGSTAVAQRQAVNTEPTDGQKEAGNYKKGHVKVDGYDITIENPKGSTRSGKDASGKAWSVPMHYDYGYIKGTEGVDGDHIDVYLSDDPTSGNVYVVDQIDQKTGKFDEHKVMYGFPSKEAAIEAYKGQYEKGWKVGTVTEVSREDFKKWVESSKRKTKPFSEYKSVKAAAALRQPTQQSASTERTEQKQNKGKTEKPKKANAGQFGLVSDERMEELKKRLRAKLNNLNMGVDPEVLAIGLELTAGYIDRGVKKFADYSKAMINDLGDVVRPYLKAFYNGVRDMPEITSNGLDAEMDDYETVSKFNVATIGKEGEEVKPSILDTAEQVSNESHVERQADRLHLDNVNIVMDASTLEGRKARAKGFYDRNTNEITIVIPNHRDVEDVMQTLLHEGVAHYGLRKMFGSHFDTFLDNVYAAADNDVRRRITELAIRKYKGDFHVATEEYLASLAEQTDFERMPETFWQKIKRMFLAMLHDIGFEDFADTHAFTLSDNELRYILWRSYENLKEPGRYRSILGEAEDVAKQEELKVGNYSEAAAEPLQTERITQKEREQKPNHAAMYGSARNSDYAAANDGVREPEAWGKRDMLSKAEQVSHGIDPDLLFRDTIEDDDNTARETYNRMADEAKSRIREAWQDSMINVRNLQQAVLEQRGEKLEDYEDAYNAENRSHGKSRAESEYFTDNLYKPLLKAVDDVAKAAKVSVGDVTEYMMAKHGLERNIVFARRDADAAYKKAYDEAKGKYDALMNASRAESDPKKADALEKAANKVKFPDYDDIFNHLRMRDYAGLTSLTGQSDVQDAEAEAQRIVNDMESKALAAAQQRPTGPSNLIDELWKATNAATKWTLKKGYESGIISKDNYNYVSGMFNYYVPLRGWQEDTAGDLFDYVGSGDKGTAFSPTLHKAKGRRSEADNPIAYIGNMAVSAIVQGNKNKVKQTFLGFVENHPTNLVTVSEMWYRNFGTDTDPDWREDVPNIPEDATADEVADIVQQHEDMMEQLEDLGKATKKRGRLHLGVPVKKGQALEHHVEVMVNGKKYVLYINGNPRAAQALNGTRQRRASERSFESSKIARMGRLLAERYTSLSPSFTVSNALRDLTMAAITTLIKESPAYAMRFRLNVLKLGGPARMFTLMKWYKKAAAQQQPTGQMSETQKYFYEFMTEGAETGFTSLKEIDEYKKDMDKMYRNMNQKLLNPKRLFRGLSQGLEYANRCIEDMTRFAIYMASRQSGRNVKRSVSDAKNVTLNFNRKGSGELGNATYRNLQIFVNPAIQSLQNVGKMAKDHPVRFTLLTGSIALIGAAQVFATQLLWSVFGGGDGDDDDWNAVDEYWKLPSWQRRNNLVMWIPGTKKFAMIPLAQEFRVFHGFGETMTTVMEGKSGENPALEVLTQASDLLPLDFAGNNGNPLVNLAPTVTQPLLQVGFNTDFTGRPLYKDNDFNKYEPSFQKAYVGTPSWLIKSSEFINDITGGDDHMQGWWERTTVGKELNNPAVVDHILKGYYGGMYSFLAQLGGTMYTLGTGNMPDAQEVPILNRVITAPREKEQNGKQKLPDWYYDLSEENARQQNEFSGYKKDYMKGDAAGQRKFNELIKGKDFQKWQKVNTYIGAVQQIRTAMNYTKDPNEKAELEKSLAEVLGELKKMKDE